ncbi:MAG: hypothetical protein NTW10_00730 [Bacteroidetes bacterium]|nr:hypothetical protein [Bacteroidota bacterium]
MSFIIKILNDRYAKVQLVLILQQIFLFYFKTRAGFYPFFLHDVAMKVFAPAEGNHHKITGVTPLKVVDSMIVANAPGKRKNYKMKQV